MNFEEMEQLIGIGKTLIDYFFLGLDKREYDFIKIVGIPMKAEKKLRPGIPGITDVEEVSGEGVTIIGSIIKKTDKAILIRRADGMVKWIAKQHIFDDTQLGKVILKRGLDWVAQKPWEAEKVDATGS